MTPSKSDLKQRVGAGIRRRYRNERAFRGLGFGALLIGLAFLGFFFYTLIATGYTALRQTRVLLEIDYLEATLDAAGNRDPAEIRQAMECLHWQFVSGWLYHQNVARVKKAHAALDPLPEGMDVSPAELAERVVTGDPETCVRKIREYEALGFDTVLVRPISGDHAQMLDVLRRLGGDVLPRLREETK